MPTKKQLANLKPAKKGEVRNPKGRPVGAKSVETIIRDAVKAFMDDDAFEKLDIDKTKSFDPRLAIFGRLVKSLIEGRDNDSNTAAKELLDRMDGKSVAKIEQTNEDVTPPTGIELTAPKDDDSKS